MKKSSTLFIILYFLSSVPIFTYSQDVSSYASKIDRKSLEGYITFLADDLTYGRGIGSKGHQISESMIREEFKKSGLIPFYHQT